MDKCAWKYAVCRMDHLPAKQELFEIIYYNINIYRADKTIVYGINCPAEPVNKQTKK
jgi:hypothetical protein